MKRFLLIFGLLLCMVSFYSPMQAQNVNININIGRQPSWEPTGYDYVDFYYFPDINCYYDVNIGMFYYPNAGRWISARYLPRQFSGYDLYRMHKVVINQNNPWRYNHIHYRDYKRYAGHSNQIVIRDSRDNRNKNNRDNNRNWYYSERNNKQDNYSNDRGNDKPKGMKSSAKRDRDLAANNRNNKDNQRRNR